MNGYHANMSTDQTPESTPADHVMTAKASLDAAIKAAKGEPNPALESLRAIAAGETQPVTAEQWKLDATLPDQSK